MKPLALLHLVLKRLPAQANGWVVCSRSELTRKLCHHPNRPGSITTADLDRLVPQLVASGLACELPRPGKPSAFAFRPVTDGENHARISELICLRVKFWDANPGAYSRKEWGDPAWQDEQALLETVGPHGGSPTHCNPLRQLAAICSTTAHENKADVPVPALSPPQTP
jgi:hypothetical protein